MEPLASPGSACYRWRMDAPKAVALLLVTLVACTAPGRAERIGTRPDGGSIMLSANSDRAWDRARELMSAHCDGSYRILGQSAAADPMGSGGGAYGLRVDYECIRKPAPVPLPVAPPGAPLTPSPPAG